MWLWWFVQGNKWWQKSDEPWQTLACCMEIAKAVRSPDPERYVCHLPIHQVRGGNPASLKTNLWVRGGNPALLKTNVWVSVKNKQLPIIHNMYQCKSCDFFAFAVNFSDFVWMLWF